MAFFINLCVVFIYYFIFTVVYRHEPDKRNKLFAIVVGMHAVLFRALADPYIFVDTEQYHKGFDDISAMTLRESVFQLNFYTHWGQGYLLWNWLISRFAEDYHFLYIATAIAGVSTVVWFYYKSVGNVLFPMIIYLAYPMMFYQSCGVLRQHFSVAFILLAIYYLDNYIKSIPLAVMACLMHTSSIVFLPFFFWNKINLKNFSFAILVPLILICLVVFREVMGFILSFMPKYEEIVGSSTESSNMFPVLWMSPIVVISLLCKLYKKNIKQLQSRILSFLYYGFAISIFSVGLSGMGRFTICFLYIIPVASMIIWKYNKNFKLILIAINVVAVIIQVYFSAAVKDYNYLFLWE